MSNQQSDIGLVGLAVMGQNLALNIADHGFRISVFNRTTSKTDVFVAENPDTPGGLFGAQTLEEFVQSLKRPRKIIILVLNMAKLIFDIKWCFHIIILLLLIAKVNIMSSTTKIHIFLHIHVMSINTVPYLV